MGVSVKDQIIIAQLLMGNNIPGSTQFRYTIKDGGQVVKFIYHDIKGKPRFPKEPQESVINQRFQACLEQIIIPPDMQELISNLSTKYKHRFVWKFNQFLEDIAEKKRQSEGFSKIIADRLPASNNELETRLSKIEQTPSTLKTLLNSLEKYLKEKDLSKQFMEMGGVARLVSLLEREEKKNREGVQNNFNNQIQLLKFFTQLAKEKNTKWLYMATIENIPKYFLILLKNFHPINISVTVPVLELSVLYFWKMSTQVIEEEFQMYRKFHSYSWTMEPFTDTLISTNNIMMVYHILKFINEFMGSMIEDDKIVKFKQELKRNRFQMILVTIKTRIEQKWYQIQYCTFDYIHRRLFDYKSKSSGRGDAVDKGILNEIFAKANRTSAAVGIDKLISNIIVENMGDNEETIIIEELDEDDEENVFLFSGDEKKFGKLIIFTLRAIDNYFQLEENVVGNSSVVNELEQREVSDAFKSLREACRESECEDILIETFRGLSGFGRANWVQLQNFMQETTMGSSKKSVEEASQRRENESLKCDLEEKDKMIKTLIRDNNEMKAMVETLRNTVPHSAPVSTPISPNGTVVVNETKTQASVLLPPPLLAPTTEGSVPRTLPSLPPPPPPSTLSSPLPPPPTMPITSSVSVPSTIPSSLPPPPPSIGTSLPSLSTGFSLPPPPPMIGTLPPPPPAIGSLPPPPPSIGLLPPPPNLGSLPPLPNIGVPGLPNIGLPGLPPLPSLGGGPKLKQKCKPSIPLKACNVSNLPFQKIKESIWEKVDDTKVQLDKQMLEALFAKPDIAKSTPKIEKTQASNQPVAPKKEKVRLIEGERSKQIEIMLTKLKTDNKILCDALRTCSGKCATLDILGSLERVLPTEDQASLIKTYSGDVQDLAIPERFFIQIIKVPDFRNRIKALIFRETYQQLMYQIEFKEASIKNALVKAKNNPRLHATLETALALSNYLNGTTIKGGAWGFKLDSIQRFQEVRSADGRENLAFILVKELWKKYPFPIFENEEIDEYKSLTNSSITTLAVSLQELRTNLNFTKKAVLSQIQDDEYDRIGSVCQVIVDAVEEKLEKFTKMHEETVAAFKECSAFYCEDSSQQSEEFGKKLLGCLQFIGRSQETLNKLAEAKKKEQERMAKKSSLTFNPQTSLPPKLPPKPIQPPVSQLQPTKPVIKTVESKIVSTGQQHQTKHKFDFVQQMKKKRETKRVNVRNSRFSKIPGAMNTSNQDFSHLGFIPE